MEKMTGEKKWAFRAVTDKSHRVECSVEQSEQMGCLHGTCFYSPLQRDQLFCRCDDGWVGTRCASQEIIWPVKGSDSDGGSLGKQAVFVMVATAAFLALIVITIYLVRRHRRNTHNVTTRSNLIRNEQRASNDSLQQKSASSNKINNSSNNNNTNNENNNSVTITIEPTSVDSLMSTNASQTPLVTSRSSSCGDDVTSSGVRRERLGGVYTCSDEEEIHETGEGISIISTGEAPSAKFITVL